MFPPPPRSTLFPYTTLFRSLAVEGLVVADFVGRDHVQILLHELGARVLLHRFGLGGEPDHERPLGPGRHGGERSEEHTSELQSHSELVCRLLLEKKKTHE